MRELLFRVIVTSTPFLVFHVLWHTSVCRRLLLSLFSGSSQMGHTNNADKQGIQNYKIDDIIPLGYLWSTSRRSTPQRHIHFALLLPKHSGAAGEFTI